MASLRAKKHKRRIRLPASERGTCKSPIWRWTLVSLAVATIVVAFICFLSLWPTSIQRESAAASRAADMQATFPVESPVESPENPEFSEALPSSEPDETSLTDGLSAERVEDELRSSLQELLESFPQDYLAVHLAGMVYTRLKQTHTAEALLRRSLEMQPNDVQVRKDLAEMLTQTGRDGDAVQILVQDFNRGAASPDFMHLLGESQIRLGHLEEACNTLRAGLKSFPVSAKNWLSLGEAQLQLNDYAQAESSIRRAIAIEPESEPALLALSQALALQKKPAEAAEIRRQLSQLRQANQLKRKTFEETYAASFKRFACSTFRSMANIYQRHQELTTAKKWLDRALEIDPTDVPTLSLLANHYRKTGDFVQAAEACQRIIQLQPEILANYTNLANLCMELGDVRRAEDALQQAAQRNLGQGRAQLQLAQFLMLLERATDAIEPARKAVQESGTIDAYLVLIPTLQAAGQFAQAEEELSKVKRLAPNDPRVQGLGRR